MLIPRSIGVILLSLTTLLLLWGCDTDMPPVARDDTAATDRNVPVTITVLANDTASIGLLLAGTVAVVAGPEHGTARAQADGTVLYSPTTDFVGTDSFSYVVADIIGETSNVATVTVTVRAVNRAPVANAGPESHAITGRPVVLDGAQSFDPDRDPLSFAWQFVAVPPASVVTSASLSKAQTAAPSFTPDVDGTYRLELTVSDGTLSSTDRVQVTAVGLPNVPPKANAGPHQTAQVGTVVLLDGRGSQDPDNGPQPLTYQWTLVRKPAASGLTNASIQDATTATPRLTPDVTGSYVLQLDVSDGDLSDSAEVTLTVTKQDPPAILTLTPNPLTLIPSTTGSVTVALTKAAGPAGQVVTLLSSNSAVASVPPHVTIPASAQSTTVTVTAGTTTGGATLSASAPGLTGGSTTVQVACPTITVTPPGVTTGIINVAFSQSFSQSGATGTAVFTVASGTLPAGLTLASSGLLAGTPTQTGSFPLTVRVTDTNGCTGTSAPYTLTIGQASAITSANATTFTVGVLGMFTITATGSPAPTFAAAGPLPAGVTLHSTTSELTGTPEPGTAGSYPLTITASNGVGSPATQPFTLTVLCPPITVNPAGPALAEGTFGVAYSQTFSASGGTAPHSFAVSDGAIPAGLTLASGGGLTGSPTTTGNFSFTVTATDVNLCTGSTAYTLPVRPNAQPESFANGVGNTQYVVGLPGPATPAVVVAGSVLTNDAGSGALTVGPVSITSTNGSVAMNPDGTFTYTPAVGFAGTDTFTYTLTDGNGFTDTAEVTINLSDAVWYVDNRYIGTSDGRSHQPFRTLDAAETPSLPNQYIFVHQGTGNTLGGITLNSGQTLWGQGTTFTLHGLTIAATGKPTVTGTITLASNVTVSSLNVSSGTNPGIIDPAGAITGVSITNGVTVATTTAPAVSLSDTDGVLTFQSIAATGAVNGISLTNTTGSFTVTGDDASARNGTGGTITNTTGDGISLINVGHVSFSRMHITNSGSNGVFGTGVNGFVVDWCSFSNNGNATGEGAIRFGDETNDSINGLVGSDPDGANPTKITNSLLSGSFERAVSIFNTSGTLTELEVTNSTFEMAANGPGFLVETRVNAVATVIVTGSTFQNNDAAGIQGSALDQSSLTLNILGAPSTNTFTNNNEGVRCSNQNDADMSCEVSNNTFTGHLGTAIFVGNGTTLTNMASLNGKILHNNVTMPLGGTSHTILSFLSGIGSSAALLISDNTVLNNGTLDGIHVNTPNIGTSPNFSVTVTNNDVTTTANGVNAIDLNATQSSIACFNVLLNTTAAPNGNGVRVRQLTTNPSIHVVSLERGNSASNVASVVLEANNPDARGNMNTVATPTVKVVENGFCATPP